MHRLSKLAFQITKPGCYRSLRLLHHQTQLQDAGPMASLLKTRAVVRFRGPDTVKFLQGLLTNDLRKFDDFPGDKSSNLSTPNVPAVSSAPVYAAMLTAQGRFLYDMFLYKPSPPGEMLDDTGSGPRGKKDEMELFADVDCSVLDELLETLKKYRLRSKVDIENVAEDFSCWQRFGGKLSVSSPSEEPDAGSLGWGGAIDKSGISAAHGNSAGWQWFKDPRLDCLGFRGIFPSNSLPPLIEADKETQEENYLLWRLEQGVAEGSLEIPKGEAMPLEYNLEGLNAISFDKGCYVGQELVARTHHRGVIRKRLIPMKFVDDSGNEVETKVAPSSEVTNAESGKKVGVVNTALGSRGMGLLRLEEAFRGSGTLAIKGQEDVKVQAIKPEWWPSEWSMEHQDQSASA